MSETSIDFTYDELRIVTRVMNIAMPIGVVADDMELPPSIVERLEANACAALTARHILTAENVIHHAVRSVIDLAATPMLMLSVEVDDHGVVDTTFLLCDEDLGVQVALLAPSVYRFTPYMTRELVRRVYRITDLRPALAPTDVVVQITAAQVEHSAALAEVDEHECTDYLMSAGAPPSAAASLAAALSQRRRSVTITAVHRPNPGRLYGGSLSWIDCGIAGNWRSELAEIQPSADPPTLELRPATLDELTAVLVSYLPAAFG